MRGVKHARTVSRLTRRVWFHALLARRSLPLSRRAKTSFGPRSSTNGACDFYSSQSFFPLSYSDGFRERRRDPLRQNAHSIIPCGAAPAICGDTPLFFFPFSLFPSCFSTGDSRDTASIRERSLGKYLGFIYTYNGSVAGN